jgi:hypothetical protein
MGRGLAAVLTAFFVVACGSNDEGGGGGGGPGGTPPPGTNPAPPTPPGGDPPVPTDVPATGTIDVALVADKGTATDAVVSLGVPFPQGVFKDEKNLTLKNAAGQPVAITSSALAKWPMDGSVRSVLVAFKATLASGAKETWKLDYGLGAGPTAPGLAANPDGPVAATLPADWYAKSRVSGVLLPVAANKRFSDYDDELAKGFATINYGAWGVSCGSTSSHRTYYDGQHAQYQRFLRSGDPKHYRTARTESVWYRQNEITWYDGRKMAVQICQAGGWTPATPIDWSVLRRMAAQGNLDDYLVTGDPAAKEAVLAFGEAYRRNLPALTAGGSPSIEATERNLGWTIMGLASYLALDARQEVRDALGSLVDRSVAWQGRGTTGGLEHDVVRPDPDECSNGPKGASPFMTSLLVDGVMDYWLLTGDTAKVEPFVRKLAEWYETKAITSDKKAFRYLWNCLSDPYDDSGTADLNILIGHVFGAAYVLTKNTHWLDFGDAMADSGVANMFADRPKQWNQSARSFGKYLGYRALGKAP